MLSRIFVSDGKAKNSFLTKVRKEQKFLALVTKVNELDANPISLLALFYSLFYELDIDSAGNLCDH